MSGLILGLGSGKELRVSVSRPHVMLICVDQWSALAFGCYGHRVIQTPTIDQLAQCGVRFTRAYSENPVCMPARRTLLTGTTPRTHGLHANAACAVPLPRPTMAEAFRAGGYQTVAVGKLHVKPDTGLAGTGHAPQRVRFGFEESWLNTEGFGYECGGSDDYEMFLQDHGHGGGQFLHGLGPNSFEWRAWHLEERLHPTNWTAWTMARAIKRRDPARPFFGFLSFNHPHPPLAPPQAYLDLYRDVAPPAPYVGGWAERDETIPKEPRAWAQAFADNMDPARLAGLRRAYYALGTHIDHQIRMVLGTLREEGMLNNTVVLFTCDHGEMLGNHRLWVKGHPFEDSCKIPMILLGPPGDGRVRPGTTDDRLVGLRDIMATLLDLAGLPAPASCEGLSMVGAKRRATYFSAHNCGAMGGYRMATDGRFKFCFWPADSRRMLFDLETDPLEMEDLSEAPAHRAAAERLEAEVIRRLWGEDLKLVKDGRLAGGPPGEAPPMAGRGLWGQHGLHHPPMRGEVEW